MVRVAMAPASSRVAVTFTSLWKPLAEPVYTPSGAMNSPPTTAPFSTVRLTSSWPE